MKNELSTTANNQELIQKLVLSGDLSGMNPSQKVQYYNSFCNSLGLNPLTQPFAFIKFQGKERLYAQKDCTEQLRKIHGVSIIDLTHNSVGDVYIVTAKAKDKEGKTDCATGAVAIKGLFGEALANALMKAETKAKRRVTLSICGLGMLDDSETDSIGPIEKKQQVNTIDTTAEVVDMAKVANDWFEAVEACQDKRDLKALYDGHKKEIDESPELKKLFRDRQEKLKQVPA